MKWVEKNRKKDLMLWIALIVINAILSVWLCFIIEAIGSKVLLFSKDLVVENTGLQSPRCALYDTGRFRWCRS